MEFFNNSMLYERKAYEVVYDESKRIFIDDGSISPEMLFYGVFAKVPTFNWRVDVDEDPNKWLLIDHANPNGIDLKDAYGTKRSKNKHKRLLGKKYYGSFQELVDMIGTKGISIDGAHIFFAQNVLLYATKLYNDNKLSLDWLSIYSSYDCKEELTNVLNSELKSIYSPMDGMKMQLVAKGKGGFYTVYAEPNAFITDIERNYNDDLEHDRILDMLTEDRQHLLLFNGEPGTGKTSYIKHLASTVNNNFLYMDYKLFDDSASQMFVDFLQEHIGEVIVLEDCEKLLMDRKKGNGLLSTILNLTDGILGDMFKIKFICTFNCKKSDIDSAMLRKGRLSLMYEFKKLSVDKVRKILNDNSIQEEKTLADVYNLQSNGNEGMEIKRIGF